GRPVRAVAAHLRSAAGEAGTGNRARGRLALGALGLHRRRRKLRLGGVLVAEDLALALAVEQREELLLLDRLAPNEDLGDLFQVAVVVGEDAAGALVGRFDDPPDLVVDLAGDLVGVVGLGRELAAE